MAEIVRNIVSIDNTNIIIKIATQKYKQQTEPTTASLHKTSPLKQTEEE